MRNSKYVFAISWLIIHKDHFQNCRALQNKITVYQDTKTDKSRLRWRTYGRWKTGTFPHTKYFDLPLPLCGPSDTFLWPKGARAPDFLTCWLRPKGGQRKDKLLIPFQGHSVAHCFAHCENKFIKFFQLPKTMKKFTKLWRMFKFFFKVGFSVFLVKISW